MVKVGLQLMFPFWWGIQMVLQPRFVMPWWRMEAAVHRKRGHLTLIIFTEVTHIMQVTGCVLSVDLSILCIIAIVTGVLLAQLWFQLLLQPQPVMMLLAIASCRNTSRNFTVNMVHIRVIGRHWIIGVGIGFPLGVIVSSRNGTQGGGNRRCWWH